MTTTAETIETTETPSVAMLEKTLHYEILQEICSMTDTALGNKIDDLVKSILDDDLNEMDLVVAKATAKICAETRKRRRATRKEKANEHK